MIGEPGIATIRCVPAWPTANMLAAHHAASALAALRREQAADKLRLGAHYANSGLVFADSARRPMWSQEVMRQFKPLCARAGIGEDWQNRKLRHSFVSQMSAAGVDVEVIADHVGHVNSNITRAVYRHALSDEVGTAAVVFDQLYGSTSLPPHWQWLP